MKRQKPNSDASVEQYELVRQFEREQARLAKFLPGRKLSELEPEILKREYATAWRHARVMLCATELLEMAEYAFTLFSGLSTDQFAAGGDSPARDALLHAITNARDRGFNSEALENKVCRGVRRAILANHSRV